MTMSNKGNGPQIFAAQKAFGSALDGLNQSRMQLQSVLKDLKNESGELIKGSRSLSQGVELCQSHLDNLIKECLWLKCAAEDAVNQNV